MKNVKSGTNAPCQEGTPNHENGLKFRFFFLFWVLTPCAMLYALCYSLIKRSGTKLAYLSDMPALEDAIILAAEAHKHGSPDKSGQPYILHPLRVMMKLDSEIERIVGVLHDVIEDTPYTLTDLEERGYPESVLQALDCLTKRKDEPYEQFIERVKTNAIARRVKIADLEDNMNPQRLLVLDMEALERVKRYHDAWRGLKNA